MTFLIFAGATFFYLLYAWLCFHPGSKHVFITLVCALIDSALWIWLAKMTPDAGQLLFYGLVWNVLAVLSGVAVPILFFGVRPTLFVWIGIGLVTIGLLLVGQLGGGG